MTFTKTILTTGATVALLSLSLTGSALANYDDSDYGTWNNDHYYSQDHNWDDQKDNSWDHEEYMNEDSSEQNKCDMKDEHVMTSNKDIVDNAINSQNLTTLVAAVQAAGLVDTLKGPGPFTVFAPTNAAFAKLPAGTVDSLLLPENKAKLAGILTYHVVAGTYKASDLTDGLTLTTVNGQTLTFTVKDGSVYINDTTKVETADTVSSNGVIHVIDSVLSPK